MKRIGIILLALAMASSVLTGCRDKEKYVKVDQKTFPDKELYYAARDKDLDHDTKLSQSEIESATYINLSYVKDFTGLDVFTNLETLFIKKSADINFDFKQFANLKSVIIDGTFESNRFDLSGNTKLEKISINSKDLEELVLPEGAPLWEITISETSLKSIDLNSYKGLHKIRIDDNKFIAELGLQDFPELTELKCSSNKKLNSLTVSNCPNLKVFKCTSNDLTDLDISGCENIEEFTCEENKSLTSLDLSAFPKLTKLDCSRNDLTALDVSSCPELTELICAYNSLTSLDLSSNQKLKTLLCGGNPFKELDVSCCPDLKDLSCWGCELTSLNITGCNNLSFLHCNENKLTSLDLTGCPKLTGLYCSENSLTYVDISKCPEMVELVNTTGAETLKDGSIRYYDGGKHALEIDKGIELVTS